jgi:hypothetical protein
MKLESSLIQVDEATQNLAESWPSDNSSDYDSRQHRLEKVRSIGNYVIGLSKKSESKEAACKDLLKELAELEKLIDPKSSTASFLYRFDRRQPRTPLRPKRKGKGSISIRAKDGNPNEQAEKTEKAVQTEQAEQTEQTEQNDYGLGNEQDNWEPNRE